MFETTVDQVVRGLQKQAAKLETLQEKLNDRGARKQAEARELEEDALKKFNEAARASRVRKRIAELTE